MNIGPGLVIAAATAALIMAVGIVDVTLVGRDRFAAMNRRRSDWILLIIFFGPLAVLLYVAAVRPQVLHPERYADADGNSANRRQSDQSDGASPSRLRPETATPSE